MKEKKESAKIIPFPELASRLVDRGMDFLLHKRFAEAADLLQQAIELEKEDYNARFGLIVALVELSKYREAKEHCQYILHRGIGDYSKTMEMYIMVLLQLNEYEEMEATISALLEEGLLPVEKEEHFENMLEFCKRMRMEQSEFPVDESVIEKSLELLHKTPQEQLIIVNQLKDDNIRKYLVEIKEFLQSPEGHPLIKTLLLIALSDQEIQDECVIVKFSKETTIIPSGIEFIHNRDYYRNIEELLDKCLEQKNPSLFELARHLLERHQLVLYPFEPMECYESWAAAYHILAEQYQGIESNEDEILDNYHAIETKVMEVLQFIHKLEEISSI
ncbi:MULTISPECIES: tetratricopeptide repeat protein [Bacillus]|uniref:tetratricopeptide repeat protein n=1 Tax=Bacillus TaxID=1386 RepID=UPI0003177EF3|nr:MULTISPECIES: tetratricopeptide repeat protein [Bacillus]